MKKIWIALVLLIALFLFPAVEGGKRTASTETGGETQTLVDVQLNGTTDAGQVEAPAATEPVTMKQAAGVYVDATGGNLSMKGVITNGPVQIKMAPGTNIAWDANGYEDVTAGGVVMQDATTAAGVTTNPTGRSDGVAVYTVTANPAEAAKEFNPADYEHLIVGTDNETGKPVYETGLGLFIITEAGVQTFEGEYTRF